MAKKPATGGGTNRILGAGEKWPKCGTCGRLMWIKPRKEGNPALVAQCGIHGGVIHLDPPAVESKPDGELSQENLEAK